MDSVLEQPGTGCAKPRVIGDYIVSGVIGKGSFAHVLKGKHVRTGEIVAIKEIPISRLTQKLLASLQSEIAILQKARHKNIVQLYGIKKVGRARVVYIDARADESGRQAPGFEKNIYCPSLAGVRSDIPVSGVLRRWGPLAVHQEARADEGGRRASADAAAGRRVESTESAQPHSQRLETTESSPVVKTWISGSSAENFGFRLCKVRHVIDVVSSLESN